MFYFNNRKGFRPLHPATKVGLIIAAMVTCLIFNPLVTPTVAQEYTPRFGIHTDPALVVWHYGNDVEGFVDRLAASGYSEILYIPMEPAEDGTSVYYFVSPTLEKLSGYTFREDHCLKLVQAAQKHNMKVFIDLQGLAYVGLDLIAETPQFPKCAPPTPDDMASIVSELAGYGVTGVSDEMFPAPWYEPVGQACREHGLQFLHKSIPWDLGAFSGYWNTTVFEKYPYCDALMTEDYEIAVVPPYLPTYEFFPSIAKWLGIEYSMKVCTDHCGLVSVSNMENVIVLKALQFRPESIHMMTWDSDFIRDYNLPNLTQMIQEHAVAEEEKPLCNVVLHLAGDEAPDTWDLWDFPRAMAAAYTGMRASGYEVITSPTPVEDADAYYIVTRGVWGNWGEPARDLPDEIVQLFDTGKPIFLQITQILPESTPNWKTVRAKLGIDGTIFDTGPSEGTILHGVYRGVPYPHLEMDRYFNKITPENVIPPAEAVSVGEIGGEKYALIIKNGNNYFINGGILDLRVSFPISNLVSDGLQSPAACAGSAGKKLSVFYALDLGDNRVATTDFHIKLPDPTITGLNWWKRDFDGIVSAGEVPYDPNAGYMDTLRQGTLLILKPAQETRVSEFLLH